MRITTNGHRREMLTYVDLTESERERFDYVDDDEHYDPRFVRAYGATYDAHDVMRVNVMHNGDGTPFVPFGVNVPPDSPLARWHGVDSESYWTGTVFRFLHWLPGFVVVGHYTED